MSIVKYYFLTVDEIFFRFNTSKVKRFHLQLKNNIFYNAHKPPARCFLVRGSRSNFKVFVISLVSNLLRKFSSTQ